MLRGNALAKLDDKGRLKIPAAFRSIIEPEYGRDFFVSSLRGESVRIYPLTVFTRLEQKLVEASTVDPLIDRLRNALNYYGQSASMDAQGRLLIHPLVRQEADLNGETTILGHQNFLEVWNRTKYADRYLTERLNDEELRQLATLGF